MIHLHNVWITKTNCCTKMLRLLLFCTNNLWTCIIIHVYVVFQVVIISLTFPKFFVKPLPNYVNDADCVTIPPFVTQLCGDPVITQLIVNKREEDFLLILFFNFHAECILGESNVHKGTVLPLTEDRVNLYEATFSHNFSYDLTFFIC